MNNEKLLSRWLVFSDLDGTLTIGENKIHPRNIKAINRFVTELGGNFALATGRPAVFMSQFLDELPSPKVPWIVLNGAGIYDFEKEEMIYFEGLNDNGKDLTFDILEKFPQIGTILHMKNDVFRCGNVPYEVMSEKERRAYKKEANIMEMADKDWAKVLFLGEKSLLEEVNEYVKSTGDETVDVVMSAEHCYEILPKGINKGSAAVKLAEILEIDYENTAAIGDYNNDIDMLKAVNLSAACGQAPEEVKKIAKYQACHYLDGAVGDLLEHIELVNQQ